MAEKPRTARTRLPAQLLEGRRDREGAGARSPVQPAASGPESFLGPHVAREGWGKSRRATAVATNTGTRVPAPGASTFTGGAARRQTRGADDRRGHRHRDRQVLAVPGQDMRS